MALIDIDKMYREMTHTMRNNFQGTPEERLKQAKTLFLEAVSESIDANKTELLQEVA